MRRREFRNSRNRKGNAKTPRKRKLESNRNLVSQCESDRNQIRSKSNQIESDHSRSVSNCRMRGSYSFVNAFRESVSIMCWIGPTNRQADQTKQPEDLSVGSVGLIDRPLASQLNLTIFRSPNFFCNKERSTCLPPEAYVFKTK